ncbi:MAG TPA: sigma-70 family RNA polymerase sigma factor [Gemmatimonadaceae bacterium]
MTDLKNPEKIERDREFEREALPWVDDVYRFALSLTRDAVDAEDVVQDTFLRAYKSWHTYVPASDCRRWLFTICRNVFLRSLERRSPTIDFGESEGEALANGAMFREATRVNNDDLFARLDLGPAIERALAKLPEPFQSTVMLVDVEDQPYETAATILGIPVGTVRSRLFRGRRLMQEMLMTHARDAGYAT